MDIGNLNCRITILKEHAERNEFGEEVIEWVEEKDLWASIRFVEGREYYKDERVKAETTAVITIRFDPMISVLNRVKYKDKLFEIVGTFDENSKHKKTILNCKEIVTYGL